MKSRIAFISLEPDAALASLVESHKQRVNQLVGPQLYLTDPPHTTLYLAAFNDLHRVAKSLIHIAASLESITVALEGWHIFSNDTLTGNHTLVCQWSKASQQAARAVQAAVIKGISPLRNAVDSEARFAPRWSSLTLDQKRSVLETGFPFTGPQWHPHLTIASIRPADWDASYGVLCLDPPRITGAAHRLKLYELIDGKPKPLHSVGLRPKRALASAAA